MCAFRRYNIWHVNYSYIKQREGEYVLTILYNTDAK